MPGKYSYIFLETRIKGLKDVTLLRHPFLDWPNMKVGPGTMIFFIYYLAAPLASFDPLLKGSLNKPISIHGFFFCYWPRVHWGSKFWMTTLQVLDNSRKTSLSSKWWEIMILQFQKEIRAAFLVLVLTNSKFCSHFNSISCFYKLAWRNWQGITFSI